MTDETQSNDMVQDDIPAVTDAPSGAPVGAENIEEPLNSEGSVAQAPASLQAPAELTPSSLNHMSDEELFGQHFQGVEEGEDYNSSFRTLAENDLVTGEIVRIDREGVLVDVGQKSEGLIRPQELGRENPEESPLAVGDTVTVMVMQGETDEGQLLLSKKRADFERAWDHVIQAQQNDETIHAMVTDRVKGGLVVDLGIRGFIPASHVGNGKVRNLEKYIGESLPLKVIEVDKERRKVVLSHRLATEGERERQREDTLESLKEGQVRAGVVRRITDYGAFVDLGGVDGLLHISEMSWSRIKHPSEVVKQGQEIQVMVLKINLDQGRISLGMRQILPDPWTEAARKYHPGDIVEGPITRLVQSGAFLQLEGGIEGFIKNSELAQRRVSRPEDVVKVGDTVQVKVLDVRPDERRIELSRKAQEKREERDHSDRQMRDYRQKQPEERFTLGDILGDALMERRAQAEAAEAGRGGAASEAEDAAETEGEMAEGAPALAADAMASSQNPPSQTETESPVTAGEAEASEPADVADAQDAPVEAEVAEAPEPEAEVAEAPEPEAEASDVPEAPVAEAEFPEAPEAPEPDSPEMLATAEPETPVAEAHADAVEPLSDTEQRSEGEQPDVA